MGPAESEQALPSLSPPPTPPPFAATGLFQRLRPGCQSIHGPCILLPQREKFLLQKGLESPSRKHHSPRGSILGLSRGCPSPGHQWPRRGVCGEVLNPGEDRAPSPACSIALMIWGMPLKEAERPLSLAPDALLELGVLFIKVPHSHWFHYLPIYPFHAVGTFFLLSSLRPLCCNISPGLAKARWCIDLG